MEMETEKNVNGYLPDKLYMLLCALNTQVETIQMNKYRAHYDHIY